MDVGQRRTLAGRLGITKRRVQIALGCLWILDAALQFQPRMFSRQLVDQMIAPMAQGEPGVVAWGIRTAAHLIRPDAGVWNFLFATVQLAVGIGLLRPRTVKPALVGMIGWSLSVWWMGEAFGQILTAHSSPLSGAPGAVILYAVIGLLVWPTPGEDTEPVADAEASAAGARGPLGARGALGAWAGLWCLSAVLWLLPANRVSTSIHDTLTGMASGEPGWYAHFLNALARHVASGGDLWAWGMAAASIVIGLGPLAFRRSTSFFVMGAVLQLAFWVTGQAFGGMFTGMGTDPNTGPLVALLALAVMPTVLPAVAPQTSVLQRLFAWSPVATGAGAAALGAAVLLAGTYPTAALAAANASPMAAMPGMDAGAASHAASSPGKSSGARHTSASGSMTGMSMGANSLLAPEAMGGTDPGWTYLGPSLPGPEVGLLTAVTGLTDGGHAMQTPSCTATPTAAQLEYALRLVQDTSSGVAPYKSLSAATAAGYIPVTSLSYPIVHYVNLAYMQDKYVLDPNHVDSLVYANTPYGPVLVAAMYLMPSASEKGPMPAGCMIQWHAHSNLCTDKVTHLIDGFTPCGANSVNYQTPVMAHVWQVPVPGGPLALDPSDLQAVEGAVMAQQCGLAPFNPATPPPAPSAGECPGGASSSPSPSASALTPLAP